MNRGTFQFAERRGGPRPSRAGFTLLELLTVMAIMVTIMTMAGIGFYKARQGTEMRSAISSVQTVLSLAREQAVVKRIRTYVYFDNSTVGGLTFGRMIIATNAMTSIVLESVGQVHEVKFLPPSVQFGNLPPPLSADNLTGPACIYFLSDGTGRSGNGGTGTVPIGLRQMQGGSQIDTKTLTVTLMLGLTAVN